jgi:hypothetical protein
VRGVAIFILIKIIHQLHKNNKKKWMFVTAAH